MCGIAGIYQEGAFDAEDAEARLRQAASAIAHRGPDAEGVKTWPAEGVGLASRRLAIIDLDPRANQPMVSRDGTVIVTFNGEIYNFREVREDLRARGASFRTESDTEVLIEGYKAWGMKALLERLCGMFAFALYDASKKTFFLARDRAGKKPLFYSDSGAVRFCSELRGLLKLLPVKPSLDPAGLDAYLSLKFVPSPATLLEGVRKLPPGFYLEKKRGASVHLERWWRPYDRAVSPASSEGEWLDRIDSALMTAVRRRLVSDVPVCLFLSGGIDSSLIASHLARAGVKDMAAYSIGYRDPPGYSEFEFSRLVAKRFPVRYKEIVLEPGEALRTLEDPDAAIDEPVSDWVWVPLYQLSRAAHRDGFKVALVGEGSDELFVGYDVMLDGLRHIRRAANPGARAAAFVLSSLLSPIYRFSKRGQRRYDLIRRIAEGRPVYMGSSLGIPRALRYQVAGSRLRESGESLAGYDFIRSLQDDYRRTAPDPEDDVNLVCWTEFFTKMSEVLLQRVDRVSMLQSLEARCPFLDHELVELAFNIPGPLKIKGNRLKGLLKELAARQLPPEILQRRKMGFSFPFKEWLRGELGPVVEKTFSGSRLIQDGWIRGGFCQALLRQHRSGWIDHAPRIWMLFDLCRWYDRWVA